MKCRIGKTNCAKPKGGLIRHTAWPVLRMTRRFARKLAEAFDANAAEGYHEALTAEFCYSLGDCRFADLPETSIGTLAFGGERVPESMANEKGWRRRPKDREYTLDFAATLGGKLVAGCVEINQCVGCSRRWRGGGRDDSALSRRYIWIST